MCHARRLFRAVFLLLTLLSIAPAHAASYVVTNANSSGAGSLRDSINSANGDGVDSAITFDASVFSTLKTIVLSGGELGLGNNGTLSITGPTAGVQISGNSVTRVISVAAGANVTLTGLSISGGKSSKGAGINNAGLLVVNKCNIFSNQSSDFGGGVYNTGNLTLTDSTIGGNTVVPTFSGGVYEGGGINNGNYPGSAILTMTGCLIRNNHANYGGGLRNEYSSTATVTNCTFYGNAADARGGGVDNGGGAQFTNCTFAVNASSQSGAGVYGFPTASGGTSITNCLGAQNSPDHFNSSVGDNGGNVQASTVVAAGLNATGLANNGGPTETIALVTKGTAVNAGVDIANGPVFDQRGSFYLRKIGGRIDSGAYESSFAIVLVSNEGLTLGVGATATITQAMLQTTDVNNDPLTYTITSGPSHGTVKLNGNATGSFTQADIAAGTVSYTQDGSFFGSDSFAFSVTDGKGDIINSSFAITITEAPSLVVTTTSDAVATDGLCSLREAIAFANSNADLSAITFNIPLAQQTGGVWIISTGSALITNESTTITGPGAALLTVRENDANKSYAVIEVWKGLTLSGVTLSNGGAGLFNKSGASVALSNCVFTGNGHGLDNNGTATVTNCTLNGNTTSGLINNSSGAIATVTNGTLSNNSYGILNFGTATVTNCTLSGNTNNGVQSQGGATVTGCNISGNSGIGFLNISSIPATLTNCTLSGNNIGILANSGSTTATNCTITGSTNTGLINVSAATLNNSLVVGNATNLGGGTAPGGTNSITTGTAAAAGLDPGGLKNNGGPTQTIALIAGGTAIDAANDANAPATDQRGVARPQGAHSDIGAFEVQSGVLTIADKTVNEGNGTSNATFAVTLSAASTQNVTVQYATANGTATAGSDYTATSGTLTFTPGQTTKTFNVPIIGNTTIESTETFVVNLSNAANASILDAQAIGTIIDDDATPKISVNNVTVTEGNSGTVSANFTVTLSSPSGKTVTVNRATAVPSSNPATAGVDYVALPTATLTFTPGQISKTVTVLVNGDVLDEIDERFTLSLSSPVNATILDGEGVGTITDNDATPSLVINNATVTEGNTGTVNANFTVTLSAVSGKTVTVNYATAVPGAFPATAGVDYVAVPTTTLTFTPGQTGKTVTVLVNGDTLDEENERFAVKLSGQANATIADNEATGTITDNDAAPNLSINDVSLAEGNSGTKAFTFTVTLSAVSGRTVTVKAQTINPSSLIATAGVDYTALPLTTLTFLPGQTGKTVTVFVNGDTSVEGTEKFVVKLSAQTNATIADSEGIGSILNDDAAPLLFENDAPSE